METSVKITSIIVSAVVVLVLIVGGFYLYSNPGQIVTADGTATISAIPDLVSVYFSVQTDGTTAEEAKNANAEIVDKTLTELIKLGFERKDIVTENFNVYPKYDWVNGNRVSKGYQATHNIRVELPSEDRGDIGKIIDAGVDSGAFISYIRFELSPGLQNQYKAEALAKATEDAKIKGESIALGLGKKIGRVISVTSSDFGYYPWRIYEADATGTSEAAKQAATNIQPGEQDISASIRVLFALR